MHPCVEYWNQLTPWNVKFRSWYCLATQISCLLMESEGSYTVFTRGRNGFLSQAILIHYTPCHSVYLTFILILFACLCLGVSVGSAQFFRPKPTHFCLSCMLSAPPISFSFASVLLIMCSEEDSEVELRERYAVCAWCLCLTASDFSFWTTSLMFTEFCVEIMPLEAAATPNFSVSKNH